MIVRWSSVHAGYKVLLDSMLCSEFKPIPLPEGENVLRNLHVCGQYMQSVSTDA
jgi:hypothetical protein